MDERIIRFFSDELPEEERILLLKELDADPLLKDNMLNYHNVWMAMSLSTENKDAEAGENAYKRLLKVRRKRKVVYRMRKAAGYAAVIALSIMATWMVMATNQESVIKPVATQLELYVPPGQRSRVTLPDGSVAWLNAGSRLTYPSFFGNERVVGLTGEAYFDVARDPDKPFIVTTENMHIKALGTQFNVHNYPKSGYISATLVHGSIKVYTPGAEPRGIILEPNQQLYYKDGKYRLETSIDKDMLLWKDGIYTFKKDRLDAIVKKMELYYDVEIVVTDPRILRYEYTGKFRQRDGVMEMLRIIQKIHKFSITKDDELNRITISK